MIQIVAFSIFFNRHVMLKDVTIGMESYGVILVM